MTPYHARYFALELRRRAAPDDVAAVGAALFDARVDLNPHQVEAALFGLRALRDRERDAPGRILADEVGLGKTIEAGLVLCQLWAERKRRLLVLVPAALRKQWALELEGKFGLPVRIAEGRGEADRLTGRHVTIASYSYVAGRLDAVAAEDWDLVVCDEAHRFGRSWQPGSRLYGPLARAIARFPKLLLTGTPLQNTLLDLYGLVAVADDRVFGDVQAFKARFTKGSLDLADLRRRLDPVLHRTLRKEVQAYVAYTNRHALTWRFDATPPEQALYDDVSEFLARGELASLPAAQRGLVTMVLRKLLASSSTAIAGALRTMERRVERVLRREPQPPLTEDLADEGLDEAWLDDLLDEPAPPRGPDLRREADELARLAARAESIGVDARAEQCVHALKAGFAEALALGAADKAVVFTESRLTQRMLKRHLEANGYAGEVVCFHGGGVDADSQPIVDAWVAANPEAAAGASRSANLRAAVVAHFRDSARVLLATEAGAEGLNLQFCSLVVNYDLPWNPQRVEQRIGRVHRYGQKHDVVVVNLVEQTNAAEARVLEILTDKFQLFEGVCGASDAVLGLIESGADIERRIHRIFQTCRTPAEIDAAFNRLRDDLAPVIQVREEKARRALLDNFDVDVHDRLRTGLDLAKARLGRMEALFWRLTRWALGDDARFDDPGLRFELLSPPDGVAPGTYELVRREGNRVADPFVYRLTHPLGERVLARGSTAETPPGHLVFDLAAHDRRVSLLEPLRGRHGWLRLDRLRVTGFTEEEYLLFSATLDDGGTLDPETAEKLFLLDARVGPPRGTAPPLLREAAEHARTVTSTDAAERNNRDFDAARERAYRWAEDQILGAEEAVKELRREERDLDRAARKADTLEERAGLLRKLEVVEARKIQARHHLNSVEDEVKGRRAAHLDELQRRIAQRTEVDTLFVVSWEVGWTER